MEERRGVLDVVDVGWDMEPSTEAVPFPPDGGVLVELGRGEAFGDSRVCSIVYSRRFTADDRSHILHGKGWGEVERKFLIKLRTGRWVSCDAASASWFLSPVIRSTDA